MSEPDHSAETRLREYFYAKDENRPLYIERAFTPDARLDMVLKTEAIAFPATTHGSRAIAEVLSRDFGRQYDNIYTYYLARPEPGAILAEWQCAWLVVMTQKDSSAVRVGCGQYDWRFEPSTPHRVSALTIHIDTMLSLPPAHAPALYAWVALLPYPWCDPSTVLRLAPDLAGLAPVLDYLRAARWA